MVDHYKIRLIITCPLPLGKQLTTKIMQSAYPTDPSFHNDLELLSDDPFVT